ncbi:MAG: hypothetical protein K8F52_15095 [Candidatus Scalindua rubra]|nr:hypothetical protein [Candidatus Scalindua rubra]
MSYVKFSDNDNEDRLAKANGEVHRKHKEVSSFDTLRARYKNVTAA